MFCASLMDEFDPLFRRCLFVEAGYVVANLVQRFYHSRFGVFADPG
jgi:hypothetical protein